MLYIGGYKKKLKNYKNVLTPMIGRCTVISDQERPGRGRKVIRRTK